MSDVKKNLNSETETDSIVVSAIVNWLTRNRRVIVTNIIIALLLGAGYMFHVYADDVIYQYRVSTELVNGCEQTIFHINFGYHPISLLIIGAVACIQLAFFLAVGAGKRWRFITWVSAILLFSSVGYAQQIYWSSMDKVMFVTRDSDALSETAKMNIRHYWEYSNVLMLLLLGIVGALFCAKWLGIYGDSNLKKSDHKPRLFTLAIVILICGPAILISRSVSNPWYLIIVAAYMVISWPVLTLVEKLYIIFAGRGGLFPEGRLAGVLSESIELLLEKAFPFMAADELSDDDFDDSDDEYYIRDLFEPTRRILGMILKQAEKLDRDESLNDRQRKEELIKLIEKMRDGCENGFSDEDDEKTDKNTIFSEKTENS